MRKYILKTYEVKMGEVSGPYFKENLTSLEESPLDKSPGENAFEQARNLSRKAKKYALEEISFLFNKNRITKEKKKNSKESILKIVSSKKQSRI
jgi:hypothetical protein